MEHPVESTTEAGKESRYIDIIDGVHFGLVPSLSKLKTTFNTNLIGKYYRSNLALTGVAANE